MSRKTITDKQLAFAVKVWEENPQLTRQEKADIINKEFNTNFDESAFRKRVNDYHTGLVQGVEKEQGTTMLERIGKARLNVKVERKLLAHERKEVSNGVNELVDRKLILDEFSRQIKGMKFGRVEKPTLKSIPTHKQTRLFVKGDDHHRGVFEDSKSQESFYFHVWREAKKMKLSNIVLVFLGDEIEGWLHTNTLRSANITPEKQLITWVKDTIKGIDMLSKDFDTVDVYMVTSSNHTQPRHLNSQRNSYPDSDMLKLAADMLQQAFRDENNNVVINAQETFTDTYFAGKRVAMTHGSLGFEEKINLFKNAYRGHDLVLKAHTHVFDVTEPENGFKIITIPAFKSWVSEYELNNGFMKMDERGLNPDAYSWGNKYLVVTLDADTDGIGIELHAI